MERKSLEELRLEIDQINRELLQLISRRALVAQEIGYLKQEKGLDYFDPAREARILESLARQNPGPFSDEVVKRLFKQIFQASISLMAADASGELLVSRSSREKSTEIEVEGVKIGGGIPVIMAGPCSVESPGQMDAIASHLKKRGIRILRGGVFKPRTSPYSFQGLRSRGLKILGEAAERHGMVTVTEVTDPRQIEEVAATAHILQVGARNMYNYELLKELGQVSRPILLKRGFMATVEEFLYSAEYIFSRGNSRIILCERGIRTFGSHTRNTLDITAIPLLKQESHLPVIADISHALGRTDIAAPTAMAALAAGADGIMVEVHDNPPVAWSDGDQQMSLEVFDGFLEEVSRFVKSMATREKP
jgi:3-deoxy-7-phosphoheptulonate synthase/chorismate mutase